METKRKDIKYQMQQGYKLQTIMHYVNKETLIKQHDKQQTEKVGGVDGGTKEEFNFLGVISNGKTLNGKYRPNIKRNRKKLKQKFEVIKKRLHENMHEPILEVGLSIRKKIIGHYAYYGVNGNYSSLIKYYKYLKYVLYFKRTRTKEQDKTFRLCKNIELLRNSNV